MIMFREFGQAHKRWAVWGYKKTMRAQNVLNLKLQDIIESVTRFYPNRKTKFSDFESSKGAKNL